MALRIILHRRMTSVANGGIAEVEGQSSSVESLCLPDLGGSILSRIRR